MLIRFIFFYANFIYFYVLTMLSVALVVFLSVFSSSSDVRVDRDYFGCRSISSLDVSQRSFLPDLEYYYHCPLFSLYSEFTLKSSPALLSACHVDMSNLSFFRELVYVSSLLDTDCISLTHSTKIFQTTCSLPLQCGVPTRLHIVKPGAWFFQSDAELDLCSSDKLFNQDRVPLRLYNLSLAKFSYYRFSQCDVNRFFSHYYIGIDSRGKFALVSKLCVEFIQLLPLRSHYNYSLVYNDDTHLANLSFSAPYPSPSLCPALVFHDSLFDVFLDSSALVFIENVSFSSTLNPFFDIDTLFGRAHEHPPPGFDLPTCIVHPLSSETQTFSHLSSSAILVSSLSHFNSSSDVVPIFGISYPAHRVLLPCINRNYRDFHNTKFLFINISQTLDLFLHQRYLLLHLDGFYSTFLEDIFSNLRSLFLSFLPRSFVDAEVFLFDLFLGSY